MTEDSNISRSLNFIKHKIVFLGDTAVGKTSIINRFIFDNFQEQDHPTYSIFSFNLFNIFIKLLKIYLNNYFLKNYIIKINISFHNFFYYYFFKKSVGIDFISKTLHVDDKKIKL